MSRLIEKLNFVTGGISQPMGFRTSRAGPVKPQMLLIASIQKPESIDSLTDYIDKADAVLLHTAQASPGTAFFTKVAKALPDIPWGCRLKEPMIKQWKRQWRVAVILWRSPQPAECSPQARMIKMTNWVEFYT